MRSFTSRPRSVGREHCWTGSECIRHVGDFEPAEIDSHYPVVLDIEADTADALWQINEALDHRFDDEGRLPLFDIGERRRLRHFDLAFDNPDFELLAKSFGAWGRILTGPGQLPDALDEAFRQPGPALLAVPVDYGENVKLTQRLGNLNFSI